MTRGNIEDCIKILEAGKLLDDDTFQRIVLEHILANSRRQEEIATLLEILIEQTSKPPVKPVMGSRREFEDALLTPQKHIQQILPRTDANGEEIDS